jgi:hypothetical protein
LGQKVSSGRRKIDCRDKSFFGIRFRQSVHQKKGRPDLFGLFNGGDGEHVTKRYFLIVPANLRSGGHVKIQIGIFLLDGINVSSHI